MKVKRFLAIILVVVLTLALAACGGGDTQTPSGSDTQTPSNPSGGSPSSSAPSGGEGEGTADFKPFTIKLSHDCTSTHPAYDYMEDFAADVKEKSGGKIDVIIYSAGQLSGGSSDETTNLLAAGDVNMALINGMTTSDWEVLKLCYLFEDIDDVHTFYDSPAGDHFFKILENNNIHGNAWLDIGWRDFTANRSLANVKDAAGLTVRIPSSTAISLLVEALGASANFTSIGELYTALQQGYVDSQENPVLTAYSRAYYEVNKYVTLTHHVFTYFILASNNDWWNSLDPAAREIIDECAKTISDRMNGGEMDAITQEILDSMEAAGTTIVDLTPEERAAWVEVGRSTHAKMLDKIDKTTLELTYDSLGIPYSW